MDNRNDTDLVFFGKYHRNLKGLFDFCIQDPRLSKKSIFLTTDENEFCKLKSKNLPVALWTTENGHQHTWNALIECKSIIYEDSTFFNTELGLYKFLERTRKDDLPRQIQLWHGIPIKDIGRKALLRHTAYQSFETFHAFLKSNNDFLVPEVSTHMPEFSITQTELNSVYQHLFDCASLFIAPEPKWLTFAESFAKGSHSLGHKERKKVLFAPTFREEEKCWSIARLDELIEQSLFKDIELIFRPHQHDVSLKELLLQNGIPFLDSETDLYELLPRFDGVITDYSSIIYDCWAARIPVIQFCFDFDYYNSRHGFLYSFERIIEGSTLIKSAGEAVDTLSELMKTAEAKQQPFPHAKEFWMNKLEEFCSGHLSQTKFGIANQ